jgi:hypothetical protein
MAREQCFPAFPPLVSQKNVSCFVHLWETRLETMFPGLSSFGNRYSLGNNVFCFAQLWEINFSWLTQLWETCPENNVSWFVQLWETWLGNTVSCFPALGIDVSSQFAHLWYKHHYRKQCFLVYAALENMTRKQGFLVCPPLRNMARKHCFMFSSLGNWCFLIICSPLGNITIGNTASLFTQLWKTWLGNNVSWFVHLCKTRPGNNVC